MGKKERMGHAGHLQSGHYMPGIHRAPTILTTPTLSPHRFMASCLLCPLFSFALQDSSFALWFEVGTDGGELCCPADIWRFWVNCGDPWNQLHQLGRKAFYNKPGLASLISFTTALWASPELIRFFLMFFLDQTCSFDKFQFTGWMWDLILGSRFWMRFWIGIQSSDSAPTLYWLLTIVSCFWMRFCIKWYTMDDLMLCSNVGCFVLTKVFTK